MSERATARRYKGNTTVKYQVYVYVYVLRREGGHKSRLTFAPHTKAVSSCFEMYAEARGGARKRTSESVLFIRPPYYQSACPCSHTWWTDTAAWDCSSSWFVFHMRGGVTYLREFGELGITARFLGRVDPDRDSGGVGVPLLSQEHRHGELEERSCSSGRREAHADADAPGGCCTGVQVSQRDRGVMHVR